MGSRPLVNYREPIHLLAHRACPETVTSQMETTAKSTRKTVEKRRQELVKNINLTSTPTAAVIRSADGQKKIGDTPLQLTIDSDTVIELRRSGFISQTVKLTTQSKTERHIPLQRELTSNKTLKRRGKKKAISRQSSTRKPKPTSLPGAKKSSSPSTPQRTKNTNSMHIIELE